MSDGLFKLNVNTVVPNLAFNNNNISSVYIVESSFLWHGRLGHVYFNSLHRLVALECLPNLEFDPNHKCKICVEAKLTKTSLNKVERSTEPLSLIHTDICVLKLVQTRGGKKYFITFIDDCTRYCYVYLLRSKDEAVEAFRQYKLEVENQLGKPIKIVRSDKGDEYDAQFEEFCFEYGSIHQTTAPYSP